MDAERMTLSVADVARELGLSKPKIYDLLGVPGFPKIRVGRRWIIPREPLERWLEARAEEGNDVLA